MLSKDNHDEISASEKHQGKIIGKESFVRIDPPYQSPDQKAAKDIFCP